MLNATPATIWQQVSLKEEILASVMELLADNPADEFALEMRNELEREIRLAADAAQEFEEDYATMAA